MNRSGVWPNGTNTVPRVTSEFGPRKSPGGIGSTNHRGIDLRVDPIRAAVNGTIIFAQYNGASGNEVRLRGDDGREYRYKHNRSIPVVAGARVSQGQVIAHEGATGAVTGPHSHFEVLINGVQVNPRDAIGQAATAPANTGNVGGGTVKPWSQDTLNRQNWLKSRGYAIDTDGREGPATRAHYKNYQTWLKNNGLYGGDLDGNWGPQTQAAHQKHYDDVQRKEAPRPPAPAQGRVATVADLRGLKWTNGLQKVARFGGYKGKIDNDFGPNSQRGLQTWLNSHYRGSLAAWLRSQHGYTDRDDFWGPNMAAAAARAEAKNFKELK